MTHISLLSLPFLTAVPSYVASILRGGFRVCILPLP